MLPVSCPTAIVRQTSCCDLCASNGSPALQPQQFDTLQKAEVFCSWAGNRSYEGLYSTVRRDPDLEADRASPQDVTSGGQSAPG